MSAHHSPDPLESRAAEDSEGARAGRSSTLVSVAVNVGLSALQIGIGLFSQSQGLLADGIHSLSDLVSDFVVLFAARHSRKQADSDHAYGHRRYENAASLALGALLLAVGIGMLWSAVGKMEHPQSIAPVHIVALWVALVAIVSKETLFRYMLKIATRLRSGMLVANAWHARSDAASSLVVAVGIVGNLLGVPLLDPIAAFVVGLMVARMGWKFMWASLNDLMDRAAPEEEAAALMATLLGTPGVRGVHDLRTRKMGDLTQVDAHLEIDGAISVREGHAIAIEARRRVLESHRVLDVMTHVDPVEVAVAASDAALATGGQTKLTAPGAGIAGNPL